VNVEMNAVGTRRPLLVSGMVRRRPLRGWVAVAATSLAFVNCVSYQTIPSDQGPAPGTPVRATLTGPGALRVSGFFGRPVQSIEGEFLSTGADSLLLGVRRFAEFGAQHILPDTIAVARTDIALLQERRLSAGRTALAVAASGVAIGVLAIGLFRAAGGSGGQDGEEPDRIRIPIPVRAR
jgi:hypothetical protein